MAIFLISEKIMRENSWNQIVNKQLYIDKITMTEKELNEDGWKITLGANSIK
jgi:hypothetical protein